MYDSTQVYFWGCDPSPTATLILISIFFQNGTRKIVYNVALFRLVRKTFNFMHHILPYSLKTIHFKKNLSKFADLGSLMCLVSNVILNISAYLLNVCWDTRYGTRCQLFQNYLQMQKFSSTLLPHISFVIIQCATLVRI